MARNAGTVQNKHTAKNVRRTTLESQTITVTNGATGNLLLPLVTAPPSSRIAIESVTIVPTVNSVAGDAAWNGTIGSLALGTSTAAGVFTANTILVAQALPSTSLAKVVTVLTTSNFASTLKTGSKAVQNIKYPIVPSGATVWSTAITSSANGVGAFALAVRFWELDDENE